MFQKYFKYINDYFVQKNKKRMIILYKGEQYFYYLANSFFLLLIWIRSIKILFLLNISGVLS